MIKYSRDEPYWLRSTIGITRRDRIRNQVIREKLKQKQTVLNRIIKKRLN